MGSLYIEAPDNTYLDTNAGNDQALIWDETTQSGETAQVFYDPGISLTYIQVDEDVTFLAGDGSTSYVLVDWPGSVSADSVTVDLIFYESDGTTVIDQFTAVGGGLGNVTPYVTNDVVVPAGGLVRVLMNSTDAVTLSIYGELYLEWDASASAGTWRVGRVRWPRSGPEPE